MITMPDFDQIIKESDVLKIMPEKSRKQLNVLMKEVYRLGYNTAVFNRSNGEKMELKPKTNMWEKLKNA